MKVLVTGGVRSGKSHHAEVLAGQGPVTYLAPGPVPDQAQDADWAERVRAHRDRRPVAWSTHETPEVAAALRDAPGPVLVDCLGTWLTALIDNAGAWEWDQVAFAGLVDEALDELTAAIAARPGATSTILVTNEVGLGVIPSHRSGRLFRDALGTVNRRVAQACDEVHLVIAGRVLTL